MSDTGSFYAVRSALKGLGIPNGAPLSTTQTLIGDVILEGGTLNKPIHLNSIEIAIGGANQYTNADVEYTIQIDWNVQANKILVQNDIRGSYWTNERYCRIRYDNNILVIEPYSSDDPIVRIMLS